MKNSDSFLPAHGGDMLTLSGWSGRKSQDIVDYSVNTRPDGPPEYLRLAMTRAFDQVPVYPSPDALEARRACAARFSLDPDTIVFGSGTAELFHALARALKKLGVPCAVIPEPAFGEYEKAALAAGLRTAHPACALTGPRARDGLLDWLLPEEAICSAPAGSAVFLANPGNPAGTWLSPARLAGLMRRRPNLVWILDEAFLPYAGRADLVSFLKPLSRHLEEPGTILPAGLRLAVLRSLTKFHGLAGVRLGYLAGTPDLACAVRAELPPWNVSCFAIACALAVLENGREAQLDERRTRAANRRRRRRLEALLKPLPLKTFRSCANYVLFRLDEPMPDLARTLLKERGLALRDCAAYRGLEDGRWYRTAVRTEEDSLRLCQALRMVLDAKAPARTGQSSTKRRRTPALMLQGACSGAGKSMLAAAFCRILRQDGYNVAPFKAQNMSLNSGVTMDGLEMGRAQILQAQAAGLLPDARMNPVLLKPMTDKGSQVVLLGKAHCVLEARAFLKARQELRAPILAAYESLAAEHDVMVLEGAGSPGEVNLKQADLVNMNMAKAAQAKVLLVGDIDRGGVYASFLGHWLTFSQEERALLKGFVVNRFRGDASLLAPAHDYVLKATGVPVLAVVPWLKGLDLPEEDSLNLEAMTFRPAVLPQPLDMAMVVLGRTANFTDAAALDIEPDVTLRLVRHPEDWGSPDVVLLPGSRGVAEDLAVLRRLGLDEKIKAHAAAGGWVVGLCGGMQIMGESLFDPLGVESARSSMDGLGLLPLSTTLARDKVLTRLEHVETPFGPEARGYEIHHGHTVVTGGEEGLRHFRRPGEDGGDVLGIWKDHLVGTYLHGLFDDDMFRRAFLDQVRVSLGRAPQGHVLARWNQDLALDKLADAVRACFGMQEIYRMLGL